jgi:hypothetical protein
MVSPIMWYSKNHKMGPPPHITNSVPYELFLLGYLVLRLGPLMDEGSSCGYEEERGVYPSAIKDLPHTTSNTRALGHSVKDWHRRSSEATTILVRKPTIHIN